MIKTAKKAIRGNYTDNPCWYATVKDGERVALLFGPFSNEVACRKWAYVSKEDGGDLVKHREIVHAAEAIDNRAWFYSFGMIKMENGYRDGVLNKRIEENHGGFIDFHK